MRPLRLLPVLLAASSSAACVFYPRQVEVYDPDCRIKTHKLVLDMAIANDVFCGGGDARACLAVIAAIGPVSAIVSGSIVVVGNTLYWLQKEGPCTPRPPEARAPEK